MSKSTAKDMATMVLEVSKLMFSHNKAQSAQFAHLAGLVVLVGLVGLAACDSAVDPEPELDSPTGSMRLDIPVLVTAGRPSTLDVTLFNSDGSGATGASATVNLTVTSGIITPTSVAVTNGHALVDIVVDQTAGPVTLQAAAAAYGDATVQVSASIARVDGTDAEPVRDLLPNFPLISPTDDFRDDLPDLAGAAVSTRSLIVMLGPTATVGNVNTFLAAHNGTIVGALPAAGAGGMVVMRFPTTGFTELVSIQEALRLQPWALTAAVDVGYEQAAQPLQDNPVAQWSWSLPASGGNWGLQITEVPQLWNFNAAVAKTGRRVKVGIFDDAFAPHDDLCAYSVNGDEAPSNDHGLFIAGIISACHDGQGIDGLNPFADLYGFTLPSPALGGLQTQQSWAQQSMAILNIALYEEPVAVLTVSLTTSWEVDTQNNAAVHGVMNDLGDFIHRLLTNTDVWAEKPLVCSAAGNDSDGPFGAQQARWASPWNNAGLVHGTPIVLVVEALALNVIDNFEHAALAPFSNRNGDLSAPGDQVMSTTLGTGYRLGSGTSFAAAHVAGLAAYLLALDPTLTNLELRQALVIGSAAMGPATAPRIRAFASAMAIDEIRGNDAVIRMLLDIDDGTVDGNLRVNYDGSLNTSEENDGDGIGDGRIDMSDFRRWRDWYLQSTAPASVLYFDGDRTSHPKFDVDGNGVWEAPEIEGLYARGDFNGSGFLSDVPAPVGGAIQGDVTDLEVLQRFFADPDYDESELDALVDSGDVAVDGSVLHALYDDADEVLLTVLDGSGATVVERGLDSAGVTVVTLRASTEPYRFRVEVLDFGEVLDDAERTVTVRVGEDTYWKPGPGPDLVASVIAPEQVGPDTLFPIVVRAGFWEATGQTQYEAGVNVSVAPTNGLEVFNGVGQTDQDGYWAASARLIGGAGVGYYSVVSSAPGFEDVQIGGVVHPLGRDVALVSYVGDYESAGICIGNGPGVPETCFPFAFNPPRNEEITASGDSLLFRRSFSVNEQSSLTNVIIRADFSASDEQRTVRFGEAFSFNVLRRPVTFHLSAASSFDFQAVSVIKTRGFGCIQKSPTKDGWCRVTGGRTASPPLIIELEIGEYDIEFTNTATEEGGYYEIHARFY